VNSDGTTIKGIRQGLLVTLGDRGWEAELQALEGRLTATPSFFRGGRIALDVGAHELSRSDVERVHKLLARNQVELWALVSVSAATKTAARELGLVVEIVPSRPQEEAAPQQGDDSQGEAASQEEGGPQADGLVVRRTLRSGQSLRHPGDVVVIGDVNSGAEVVAGGNIVVWGRVRGLVHAGALGDETAVICALHLSPTQLRIGSHIARTPEEQRSRPVPEMVVVRNGQLVAVPWHGGDFRRGG
jgi:septum site-determining protein MinC